MGDYFIKKEDGKEVVYRTSLFGTEVKVGELKEDSWLSSTKSVIDGLFGPVIEVGRENLSGEREARVDGIEGVFSRNTFFGVELRNSPSFKPHGSESSNDSQGSNYSSPASSYSSSYSSGYDNSREPKNSDSSSGSGWKTVGKIALGILLFGLVSAALSEREK